MSALRRFVRRPGPAFAQVGVICAGMHVIGGVIGLACAIASPFRSWDLAFLIGVPVVIGVPVWLGGLLAAAVLGVVYLLGRPAVEILDDLGARRPDRNARRWPGKGVYDRDIDGLPPLR